VRIDGIDRHALSVHDAIAAGIAFVHQELNLFENLDVRRTCSSVARRWSGAC
jgi:ribose transport system ATP-binding protein